MYVVRKGFKTSKPPINLFMREKQNTLPFNEWKIVCHV